MFRRVSPLFSSRFFSTEAVKAVKAPKAPKVPKAPKAPKEPKAPKTPKAPKDPSAKPSNILTRKLLVDEILAETKLEVSKANTDAILSSFLKLIQSNVLSNGKTVRLPYFGSFSMREQAARTARNPRSGEEVSVPAKQKLAFKPSKSTR